MLFTAHMLLNFSVNDRLVCFVCGTGCTAPVPDEPEYDTDDEVDDEHDPENDEQDLNLGSDDSGGEAHPDD